MKRIPRRLKCVRLRNQPVITLKEFAKRRHVSTSTALSWIRRRIIEGYKFGGRWYVYEIYASIEAPPTK